VTLKFQWVSRAVDLRRKIYQMRKKLKLNRWRKKNMNECQLKIVSLGKLMKKKIRKQKDNKFNIRKIAIV
jgi:hypothetical protein